MPQARLSFMLPYVLLVPVEGSMKKILLLISLLLLPLALSACNTLQGVGEDMKQGGQALDRAVK